MYQQEITPIFIFHADEKKFPIDIEKYIKSCKLNGITAKLEDLKTQSDVAVLIPPEYSLLDIPFADEQNFRCYKVEHSEGTKYILFFFKENGRLGIHYVDVQKDFINFDGYKITREKLIIADNEFEVYVSYNNHTLYPFGDDHVWCHALIPIDYTNKGRKWSPEFLQLPVEISEYRGKLHPDIESFETKKIDVFSLPRDKYINVLIILLVCCITYVSLLYAQYSFTPPSMTISV
jgi:hypothetical protein